MVPTVSFPEFGLRPAFDLAEAQRAIGHTVTTLAVQSSNHMLERCPDGVTRILPAAGPWRFSFSPRLVHEAIATRADVIHSHGLWTYASHASHVAARRLRAPHVCSPHGMLDTWSLRRSRRKKAVIAAAFQRRVLAHAACLHALAPEEVAAIRAFGFEGQVACIPVGVDRRLLDLPRSRQGFDLAHPGLETKKIVLFLSRVHPKKNLIGLIRAWQTVSPFHQDWHLVIAGPDRDGHGDEVVRHVRRLRIESTVSFIGHQSGPDVWSCLQAADVFVLPSLSEGLSMAVLEALACAVPVCVTRACHVADIEETRCGVYCGTDPASIAGALSKLMGETEEALRRRGAAARQLIRGRHSVAQSAVALVQTYRELMRVAAWRGGAYGCA